MPLSGCCPPFRAGRPAAVVAVHRRGDARRRAAPWLRLNAEGKLATVDVLGEEVTRREEAERIAEAYRGVLAAIEGDGLDANISVKLRVSG